MKTALVIIDMQKAYFHNEALESKRRELIGACNELIEQAKLQNIPVFHAITKHKKDRTTWTLNMLDDGEGYLFEGDADSQIVEGLQTNEVIEIVKTRDSAFFGTTLFDELSRRGVQEIILAGVSTHTCVFQTAADAYANNLRVVLAGQAIASHDPKRHQSALELLKQEYRQQTYDQNLILKTMFQEKI